MSVSLKHEGAVLFILLVLVALSWWWPRGDDASVSEHSFQNQKEVDAYLRDFEVTAMNEQGRPNHRLKADKMVLFSGTDLSQVDKPYLTLYRDDATPWLINADYGLLENDTDTVFLTGNVRMTNEDRSGHLTEVLTDSLEVRVKTHYAVTEHPVQINHYQGHAQGQGLEAYLREGRLALLDQVRSRYEAAGN